MKNPSKTIVSCLTISLALLLCSAAQAQNTETATGTDALANDPNSYDLNTADGYEALASDMTADQNRQSGVNNTATGAFTLEYENGVDNTGDGTQALFTNENGSDNTGVGFNALRNSQGSQNTGVGSQAFGAYLDHLPFGGAGVDITGSNNTGVGFSALYNTTSGSYNTASGAYAMYGVINFQYGGPNTLSSGSYNTATGYGALEAYTSGSDNTAYGSGALSGDTTGSDNIGIGSNAGTYVTTGTFNIEIGNRGLPGDADTIRVGLDGKQTKTYVAGIFGATAATGVPVYVTSGGRLGTLTSSAKFKKNIHDMGNVSNALLALRPVTFQYKSDIDPTGTPQFGLVAEEVEKVDPDLVVHDADHQIYTVRYEAVNAMLLNEFQKQHATMVEQEKTIAEQQKLLEALSARLDQVEQAVAKKP